MQHTEDTLEVTPESIGPYRIIRVLGEGGMGTVYEAADTGAVRRNVALKVVRAGLGSREVKARFDAERQALALMDHPGIAKVLNAGSTADGQPYFAMELVKGLPVDQFCDTRRLSTNERLTLFVAICHAVQHAHQKGVIHRDIKPSNVLVTELDGKPQPKIIDFGIAKALGLKLTDLTMVTMAGTALGTASYMSPEQAESSGIDVDTRTDIYSLGVVLYQLLVGRVPAEPSADGMAAFIYRLASGSADTPRPSSRLNSLTGYKDGIAAARRTTAEHLRRDLKGDLDWVVMKALEPQRTRRYETAAAFAADVQRFLEHKPVDARPPSPGYLLQKFVRRNRASVAIATVAVLALATSLVFTAVGMVRAEKAERAAAREADATKQVSDFLVDLFRIPTPSEAAGRQVTARDILDRGASRSLADLAAQPQLQARMMLTIGTAYSALGLYTDALAPLQRALTAQERALGPSHPAVAETELAIGDALRSQGNLKPAEAHYQRALSIIEKVRGPEDPQIARGLIGLGNVRLKSGLYAEAESLYRRAVSIDEKRLDPDAPALARDLSALGIVYWSLGRPVEGEPLLRRSLEIQERRLGPGHADLAPALSNLGAVYWTLGRYTDALPLYERARKIAERTLDPMHPNVASVLNNLGETYWKLKRYKDGEPLFKRALEIEESRLAANDPAIAVTLNSFAGMLRDQGRLAESEAAYKRALAIRQRAFPAGDPNTAETINDYAALLKAMGRGKEADALLSRSAPSQ